MREMWVQQIHEIHLCYTCAFIPDVKLGHYYKIKKVFLSAPIHIIVNQKPRLLMSDAG